MSITITAQNCSAQQEICPHFPSWPSQVMLDILLETDELDAKLCLETAKFCRARAQNCRIYNECYRIYDGGILQTATNCFLRNQICSRLSARKI